MLSEAQSDPKYSHVSPCTESLHRVYVYGDVEMIALGTSGREVMVINSSIKAKIQSYLNIFYLLLFH